MFFLQRLNLNTLLFLFLILLLTACAGRSTKTSQIAPTIDNFIASESSIEEGQAILLSWKVSGSGNIDIAIDQDVGDVSSKSEVSVTPIKTTTYTLTATNTKGSVSKALTVEVKPKVNAPTISSFTANPANIEGGEITKLEWVIVGSEPMTLSIDQGIGDVSSKSEISAKPTKTTEYTITATNSAGSVSKALTVEVKAAIKGKAPVIDTFKARPSSIKEGDSTKLEWAISGTEPITISIDQGIGDVSDERDITIQPTKITKYTLTATNAEGSVSKSLTVQVEVDKAPTISSFKAKPSSIKDGESTKLEWVVSGTKPITLSIDQGIGDVSGKNSVSATPTETTKYILTATNVEGSVSKSLTVKVNPLTISNFKATPSSIDEGESTKLEWEVSGTGPIMLSINQGVGDVSGKSEVDVTPTKTISYTLTAKNADGETVKEIVRVQVKEVFSSNLPIISIDSSKTIVDSPKVKATMSVYGGKTRNFISDTAQEYIIGIEIRGRTSQSFPKKQYSIETRTSSGDSLNVPLLGFPKENDWVLYAPYTDKSLMRNVLAYNLARRMGRYASRIEFVEVFINGDYKGIYVLMEKVKRDDNRVDVNKQQGGNLEGGYILELGWSTEVPKNGDPYIRLSGETHPVLYKYPKPDEISSAAKAYISAYVIDFHTALYSSDFKDPENGYRKYIDVDAAVDYMIIQELFKNVDAYLASTFIHKDIGGKLTFGPVWDFNISSGNDSTNAARRTTRGFMLHNGMGRNHIWAARLLQDPYFVDLYTKRWKELKAKGILRKLLNDIDRYEVYLDEAQERNFDTWPILNKIVRFNPTDYKFNSYAAVLDDLDDWFEERISWIDRNIDDNLLIR